ncbi:hypothetical protein CK203_035449 [Vitis vinifera]|uniref:Uncharacterized protein n=1 Tax=Vitis vinifera TaxID=29760 RepID=A0A438I3V7_VITVI|nr:hypothetical protein CK203_035449 [Vitis vinifera]
MYMQYFHPDNMSSAEKLKVELKKVRDEFKMSESDCGSARVQVAQLTTKIKHLNSALHKKMAEEKMDGEIGGNELFELSVHEVKGKLLGKILESSRCYSSWIRFGELGLSPLLEEVELCCWGVGGKPFSKERLEGERIYMSECHCNEGYGLPKGRVVQLEGRNKLRVSSNESFADKVKKDMVTELQALKKCAFFYWHLQGEVNLSLLRGALILFELDSIEDASEVLHRGLRRFANKCLSLDRWLLKVRCFRRDIHAKEASRVWDKTLFKYLRDCHGGFVLVDISIVKQRNLQWARILVGSNDKNIPRLLQLGEMESSRRQGQKMMVVALKMLERVFRPCVIGGCPLQERQVTLFWDFSGPMKMVKDSNPLIHDFYGLGQTHFTNPRGLNCRLRDVGCALTGSEGFHSLVPLERDHSEGCEKGFWLNILASQERRNLEEGAPFVDATLLFGVEGFAGKLSSPVCWMGDGFSSASSISKDEGPAKSLVLWREQDKGLVVECKGDGYGMLYVGSEEVVALENGSSRRDSMGDESLYDLSFGKFVSFSKFLDLLVEGYEKEIVSLLRKSEAKKGYRVVALSIKRRPSSMSDFDRELCKLECLVNYNKSSGKGGSQKWGWDMVCCHYIVVSNCYKMNDHVLFMHVMVFKMQDKHSRKGLQAMVQRRKKLLKYLRRTDWDSYCLVLSKLGLRDNPNYKN